MLLNHAHERESFRHAEVEEDDVGRGLREAGESLGALGDGADDRQLVVAVEQVRQAFAQETDIRPHEDADHERERG